MKYQSRVRPVHAYQFQQFGRVDTQSGPRIAATGDWLVTTTSGVRIVVTDEEFRELFEPTPADETDVHPTVEIPALS